MPNKGDINPQTGLPYAVNPQTGQWDDNYWATVVEPALKGGGGQMGGQQSYGGGGSNDVLGLASQIASFGQQQTADVKNSLQERYKSLLDQVGQQASRELGARGIPISSDSAQQFIQGRQLPYAVEQNSQLAQFGYDNNQAALQAALQQLQLQQQQNQFNQNFGLQQQRAPYEIDLLKAQAYNARQPSSPNIIGYLGGGSLDQYYGSSGMASNSVPDYFKEIPSSSQQSQALSPAFQRTADLKSGMTFPSQRQTSQPTAQQPNYLAGAQNVLGTASRIAQSTPQYKAASNLYNTAQNLVKSQPVQRAVSTVSNIGRNIGTSVKNLASTGSNLFRGLFG